LGELKLTSLTSECRPIPNAEQVNSIISESRINSVDPLFDKNLWKSEIYRYLTGLDFSALERKRS